jgi:aspartate-semialdehyde dehydrogenase
MAHPIADRAAGKVAVLGAASPAGAHLKAALADRGIPGERVSLFGLQREIAVISEYDGEARLVQTVDDLEAASFVAVFVCEAGHDVASLVHAAASGTLVVDMTGAIPGAVLTPTSHPPKEVGLVAVPHPVTTLLVSLLEPLQQALGLARVSAHVLRPASDFGEAGLEELREQTVHLLRFEPTPTAIFGRQLAFNVLPEYLFPAGEEFSTARIVRESRDLLRTPDLPFALSQSLVPLFFGHAIAAHVDLANSGRAEALEAWKAAPDVAIAEDPDTGATLDAPEASGLLIARVDAMDDATLRVWALGSEAGATAAARAVAVGVAAGVL